ncbi:galactose oxidase [Clavulina sp. PMI_390]|nr:galactose oxidase [Clavulina sp. PMI_390]
MVIFGGLFQDEAQNDLQLLSAADYSCVTVETTGEAPSKRVGHASALFDSTLIVWGGDTMATAQDVLDSSLYLLDLDFREWIRVKIAGDVPPARYGHAAAMCGSKFYVYGGQEGDTFFDDMWSFDLDSCKSTWSPLWERVTIQPGAPSPSRRTGHAMITYEGKIYLFGGTDGKYHYNDTWCYDPMTDQWNNLTCIGFIPSPRESHAAAIVDDTMYIFGGRGVDGKDLGDLAAFKISNQRWYMFQNMGPAPSGRSGHAMATVGSKIFVIGGEGLTANEPDDPSLIHALETRKLKES